MGGQARALPLSTMELGLSLMYKVLWRGILGEGEEGVTKALSGHPWLGPLLVFLRRLVWEGLVDKVKDSEAVFTNEWRLSGTQLTVRCVCACVCMCMCACMCVCVIACVCVCIRVTGQLCAGVWM